MSCAKGCIRHDFSYLFEHTHMKKWIKKLHLYLSLPIGLIISLVCFTGAALVFEPEITQAIHPEWSRVEPTSQQRLTPSALVAKVKSQVADTLLLTSLQYGGKPESPAELSFQQTGRKKLLVNPYSGEVIGWSQRLPFFNIVFRLHRWLMDSPKGHGMMTTGKLIVGISVLVMVFILLSGLWIWMPRNIRMLIAQQQIHWRRGMHRLFYESHYVLGIYAFVFLLAMSLTGLTWSFPWFRSGVLAVFGVEQGRPDAAAHGQKRGDKGKVENKKGKDKHEDEPYVAVNTIAWDRALNEILHRYPGYTAINFKVDKATVNTAEEGWMRKEDEIKIDVKTGNIAQIIPYAQRPAKAKAQGIIYAIHSGTWGGMFTRILYFFATIIGGFLPLTGYYMYAQKRLKKKRRKR